MIRFRVLEHYPGHLEALQEYADLYRRADGSTVGVSSRAHFHAAHGDNRLGPRDAGKDFPVEHLVVRVEGVGA